MAIYNGDNSWQMNHNTINDSLLNTMKKTSEKTVENLGYDKTILASIQYCSDATLGQYKLDTKMDIIQHMRKIKVLCTLMARMCMY